MVTGAEQWMQAAIALVHAGDERQRVGYKSSGASGNKSGDASKIAE
jgi:hypothetical protein